MKMNKKGFTLIELLAVIVILAVIALIAVPQVLRILNEARKSAAQDSAYGVLDAAESYVATYMLTNQGDWVENDVDFTCSKANGCQATIDSKTVTLEIKGTTPTEGVITLSSTGEATIKTALKINNFSCTQAGSKVECNAASGS